MAIAGTGGTVEASFEGAFLYCVNKQESWIVFLTRIAHIGWLKSIANAGPFNFIPIDK